MGLRHAQSLPTIFLFAVLHNVSRRRLVAGNWEIGLVVVLVHNALVSFARL